MKVRIFCDLFVHQSICVDDITLKNIKHKLFKKEKSGNLDLFCQVSSWTTCVCWGQRYSSLPCNHLCYRNWSGKPLGYMYINNNSVGLHFIKNSTYVYKVLNLVFFLISCKKEYQGWVNFLLSHRLPMIPRLQFSKIDIFIKCTFVIKDNSNLFICLKLIC